MSRPHPFSDRRAQSRRGRVGGLRTAALHDSRELTGKARAASAASLRERLLREVDPDGLLSEADREVRLARARRAHFTLLSIKAAAARSKRAQRRHNGGER